MLLLSQRFPTERTLLSLAGGQFYMSGLLVENCVTTMFGVFKYFKDNVSVFVIK